jgi:hypothetical protein
MVVLCLQDPLRVAPSKYNQMCENETLDKRSLVIRHFKGLTQQEDTTHGNGNLVKMRTTGLTPVFDSVKPNANMIIVGLTIVRE